METKQIIGELIPIVAIVLGIACAMFATYLDFRKKRELIQLFHAERMAAIEKGIELPPLPVEYFGAAAGRPSAPEKARRTGLILLFLGIAITIGLWGITAPDLVWLWGLVPVGLGVAFLLAAFLEAREAARPNARKGG